MFAVKTILHPTDFSERSDVAFRFACALARDYGARLVVLHVVELPPVAFGEGVMIPSPAIEREPLREQLRQRLSESPEVRGEARLAEGDPAPAILRAAKDVSADLIVLGTHGRTGLGRLLMGSVAEQVVRKADCPVLTVKCPPPKPPAVQESGAAAAGEAAEVASERPSCVPPL
jgi:nucleotide-binding universal stress UspA family protein